MKLLYHGPLWKGGTALQRAEAFAQIPDVQAVQLDTMRGKRDFSPSLYERARWKIGWPADSFAENERLIDTAQQQRPDVVLVDNSKVLRRDALLRIRDGLGALLVYYSPDDVMAPHNLKRQLKQSFDLWDVFFTTKTHNLDELTASGVRHPVLAGNAFDPSLHRPLSAAEAGAEFEAFDLVFMGALEHQRCTSLNRLAEAGMTVLVHGPPFAWPGEPHPNITLRGLAYAESYSQAAHHGKVALGFLRKINRDCITTRSIELPAMARPMLAEKTEEHDAHFVDGVEYMGFVSDDDLVQKAKELLADPERRHRIAAAGRRRCLSSGYSTSDRAQQMMDVIRAKLEQRGPARANASALAT